MIEAVQPGAQVRTPEASDFPILVEVEILGEELTTYRLDPQMCADILDRGIMRILAGGGDENAEAKRLTKVLRMGVKGLLLAVGPSILKFYLGAGHPKPGPKDDLVEWYSKIFAKIGIAHAVQNISTLHGARNGTTITTTRLDSRPNPATNIPISRPTDKPGESAEGEPGGPAEGEE